MPCPIVDTVVVLAPRNLGFPPVFALPVLQASDNDKHCIDFAIALMFAEFGEVQGLR